MALAQDKQSIHVEAGSVFFEELGFLSYHNHLAYYAMLVA